MTDKHRKNRARKIRELSAKGVSGKELAKRYGLSKSYISRIILNQKLRDPDYVYRPRQTLKENIGEIKRLRQNGRTFAEIGEQLGLRLRKKVYAASSIKWALQEYGRSN